MKTKEIISKEQLLRYWQMQRAVTRQTIELFPEEEFYAFTIGGMRTFAVMIHELLSIAGPGLAQIVSGQIAPYEEFPLYETKQDVLNKWDQDTIWIDELFEQLAVERFADNFCLYGDYDLPIIQNILYFIDNEIHHRAQGFVYLRALGIKPPFFWESF